jgi:alpha-L-fucosidase 2
MKYFFYATVLFLFSCSSDHSAPNNLRLWYDHPASQWTEALPIGNGRLGAMVFGSVAREHLQFNEETLWTGQPHDYAHEGASEYLEEIRALLFAGEPRKAENLAMEKFMSDPLRQKAYQPFGDLYINFEGHESYSNYSRELDLTKGICKTSYTIGDVGFTREVMASFPDQVIVIQLEADKGNALNFSLELGAAHESKTVIQDGDALVLDVEVADGGMKGRAMASLVSNGDSEFSGDKWKVRNASSATIYLSASTNYVSFREVSEKPSSSVQEHLQNAQARKYHELKERHLADYRQLFDRFSLDLGASMKDTLPTDERIAMFQNSPDPQLVALYVQYGRYLLISSSREGTHPANLQGIWNHELKPAWDSKYTVNINTEMNYWPAELTNLSECHDPLFKLIEECAITGQKTAKTHYNANGWVLHHNTDQWRGTAPINHSNHGIWVSGSGWLSTHLWEHYLFTQDEVFLRNRAYPIMKNAAVFYTDFLIEDPKTGWLISTPSNSPENGGLVAGPTMDHQIIRTLFKACVEASEILDHDGEFASKLKDMIPRIAPNQIGQHGQLQEWLEDKDDPDNKHRHVSHLWGMHPAKDINWEESPDLMEAARQSLIFRGDDGTGWSLAWKINFWARFLDGNHANELIKLLFRMVKQDGTRMSGGGSYPNLFDAHPPFQIDGNFGAAAGIVELLLQSHLSSIDVLPALPDAYPSGSISGVCARGGFELDIQWHDMALQNITVRSKAGKLCRLKYKGKIVEFSTEAGKEYKLNAALEIIG